MRPTLLWSIPAPSCVALRLAACLFALMSAAGAMALEAVPVPADVPAIDLTRIAERYMGESDRIQVSTAPGSDGIVRRIEVRALNGADRPDWAAFALTNTGPRPVERLLVAPHFSLVGSGLIWPDLGSRRIVALTPSQGLRPERQASPEADVFLVTLEPGAVVTYVAELAGPALPQLYLWEPNAYKDKVNAFSLYHGMVLGIAGLLAVFLTIIFVVKGTAMFPAAAGLAWAVLAYLVVDFGFWHKVAGSAPETARFWRALAEIAFAATLLIFLFAYLHLNRWSVRFSHVASAWLVALLAVVGLAIYRPEVAAGVARLSLVATGVAGFGLIAYLGLRRFDRAIMLVPTWTLFLAWLLAGWMAVVGWVANDLVSPALAGALVLFVLLIGFTVMQHAFAGGAVPHGLLGDLERKALAIIGAGDVVWDWDVVRDNITVSADAERALGLEPGALDGPARDWLVFIHPADRDRFRATLDAVVEQRRGRVDLEFRLRAQQGHHVWYRLRARPVVGSDGEVLRCVGTLVDVTELKTAEERLLHDAVHDNLTGLPNRQLFLDRLETAMTRARTEELGRPVVLLIDLDRFKQVNDSVGLSVGDSVLLTVARRLARLLKPQDTLARISGDQFGVILLSETEPERARALADQLRKAIRAPIGFGDREIFVTASIGMVAMDARHREREDLLKDCEIAMYHAKRMGMDRLETFRPAMRAYATDRLSLETDLRRALERDEIRVLYQPIVRLDNKSIVGFEALLRWDHPRHGRLAPKEFIAIAEETGLILELGAFVLERTARHLLGWQQALPNAASIFASVNVSSRQLLRNDLINDLKAVLARHAIARGSIKLEVTESLVMENPEYATQVLTRLRELGAGLSLDDFGTGYSSLAYLQRFPFDTLKIDQSFLRGNARGQRPVILRSIVALAHDLGMDVVAEGAETEADAAELARLGCEFAQGFLFGAPVPPEEALKLLTAQSRTSRPKAASRLAPELRPAREEMS